ncbi:MAG: FAD-dependent oxidoreductase [Geminicoccaceae bacterium]
MPTSADPDRYAHRHAHCDLLVVGAGPAGLAAALAAGRKGERVILVDENSALGGSVLGEARRARLQPGPEQPAVNLRRLKMSRSSREPRSRPITTTTT